MKKIFKILTKHFDTICQAMFLIALLAFIKSHFIFFAVLGGITLLAAFLYPKEYKKVKNMLFA